MSPKLNVEKRTATGGKGEARKLRKTGLIPAVVYGAGEEATSVSVDPRALSDLYLESKDRNLVINVKMGKDSYPCLVRQVQRNPLSRQLVHVDFYKVPEKGSVQVMVPVRGVGRAKGMVVGGRLRIIRREIKIRCNYKDIPASIEHDITPMEVNEMVKVSELVMPKGCTLVAEQDFNVLTVYGKRLAVEHDDAEAPE
jgi:large subunit ribosomal protein L25